MTSCHLVAESRLDSAVAGPRHPLFPATACFAVTADADPGILSRVLEPIAKRGLTVDRLMAVQDGDARDPVLHIDLHVSGLDDDARSVVAAVLDQTVGVRLVLSCEKNDRGVSRPDRGLQ
jgi:acetolactate synthase regulatory subunit